MGADLDVNGVNSYGWTPLLCALILTGGGWSRAADDVVQTAQFLLSRGADATAVSAEGRSALYCLAGHTTHPGDTRFSALAEGRIREGAPLRGRARGLELDWRYKAAIGGLWWGFGIRRLAGAGVEGGGHV